MKNIFHKVAAVTMRRNRTRTMVTVLGIVLSMALFTAITVAVSSFEDFMVRYYQYNYGSWQGRISNIEKAQADSFVTDGRLKEYNLMSNVGYAQVDTQNQSKPYLFIAGISPSQNDLLPIHMTQGRMPKDGTEILLPDHLYSNGGVQYEVGDTLDLQVGIRVSQDGAVLWQDTGGLFYYVDPKENTQYQGDPEVKQYDENGEPLTEEEAQQEAEDALERRIFVSEESLQDTEPKTYTVVGFYDRMNYEIEDFLAPGYMAITGSVEPAATVSVYFTAKNPRDINRLLDGYGELLGTENGAYLAVNSNGHLLSAMGYGDIDGTGLLIHVAEGFFLFFVILGSGSLIYNAFSISVSERTKQFGLLKSVGATKRQLLRMVLYEAGVLVVIGIPLGLAVGCGGIGITLTYISRLMRVIASRSPVTLRFYPSFQSLGLAVLFCAGTILVSAAIPALRIRRISPMEAIRQNQDVRLTKRQVRTPKFLWRLFGFEGTLALKNFRRSKSRFRVTIASLSISVILFVSGSSFCSYMLGSLDLGYRSSNYDVIYQFGEEEKASGYSIQQLTEQFSVLPGVEHVFYCEQTTCDLLLSPDSVSEEYMKLLEEQGYSEGDCQVFGNVLFIEDESYRAYLEEEGLPVGLLMDPSHPTALFCGQEQRTGMDENGSYSYWDIAVLRQNPANLRLRFYDYGESDANMTDITVPVGACVEELPYLANFGPVVCFPLSARDSVTRRVKDANFVFTSEDATTDFLEIEQYVRETLKMDTSGLSDYTGADTKALIKIVNIFAYGFIILLSLVAGFNVFNTISTNIALRRRELAVLKSLGLSDKGLYHMMSLECLIYGFKSLIYGILMGTGISYLIYRQLVNTFLFPFYLPGKSIAVAVGSVFILVFVSMLYAVHKLHMEDPVEALKQDVL